MSYNSKAVKSYLLLILTVIFTQTAKTFSAEGNNEREILTPYVTPTTSASYKPNILHFMSVSNGIRNHAVNILNITDIYQTTANKKEERNQYLSRLLLHYSDETALNLINREFVLRRHCVGSINRITNQVHAQFRHNIGPSGRALYTDVLHTSDEDYFLEHFDDDYSMITTSRINQTEDVNASRCPSCQRHEKAKQENLESIKHHILMRLQLSQPPNITVPPSIPQKILDYFYKNLNYFKTAPSQPQSFKTNHIHRSKPKTTNTSAMNETDTKGLAQDEIMLNDEIFDVVDNDDDDDGSNENVYNDDNDFDSSLQHMDEFYSHPHSIYIFPTKSHIGKPEIFYFKFNSDPSSISSTILHVFIKGLDWNYTPNFMDQKNLDISLKNRQEIIIVVYRALRRNNTMNYTHTVKLVESRQKIPPGIGQWVEIEIKEISSYWLKSPNSTQSIVIRGTESWMSSYIVTEDPTNSKSLTMHIEIITKVKNRHKRNAGLDCHESDNEVRCCRYPLKVNFTNFGWNFIVAPQHFDAYFCNGECNVGYLEKYTHTHITSLTTSAKPCCSPQKLSALALLYFDNNNKLMYSTIPNMSVEKCSCS